MYYSILGMEPIVAFYLLHSILFISIIFIFALSKVKKLQEIHNSLDKINIIILLLYYAFHAFCICMIFLSVFSSNISTQFWLILYLKFWIAMGSFIITLCAIAVFLAPFGLLGLTINAIKNVIKL